MSFLDNLENNLKALEGREEGGLDERARRDAEAKQAKAAAPWAEKLRNGPWTKSLMGLATRAGFQRRLKVNLIWIGTTLRLEARGQRLELQPIATGVVASFIEGGQVTKREPVNLDGDPGALVSEWMQVLDATAPPPFVEVEEAEE